jgi:hypothetical protein
MSENLLAVRKVASLAIQMVEKSAVKLVELLVEQWDD